MATYTQMLTAALSDSVDVTVLADVCQGTPTTQPVSAGGVRVSRAWEEGSMALLPIGPYVARERKRLDVLHIQHEFLTYGSLWANLFLIPLLALCKALRIPTVLTFHGVITVENAASLGLAEYGFAARSHGLLRLTWLWVRMAGLLAGRIVVHERWQQEALVREYQVDPARVAVIPHGIRSNVEAEKRLPLMASRPRVLFFGFLAPYKGLDLLLEAASTITAPAFDLLIAGDASPRAEGQPEYNRYLRRIDEMIGKVPCRVERLGFVPEEEVARLFQSVDLVVLPYASIISSSGPLALAVAYGTPVLANPKLLEGCPDSVYDGTVGGLRASLVEMLESPARRERSARELANLRAERSWSRVAQAHTDLYRQVCRRKT